MRRQSGSLRRVFDVVFGVGGGASRALRAFGEGHVETRWPTPRLCGRASGVHGRYPPQFDPWSRCRASQHWLSAKSVGKKSEQETPSKRTRSTHKARPALLALRHPTHSPPAPHRLAVTPACLPTNPAAAACPCADNMALYSLFKLTVLCALFHEAAAAVRRQPPPTPALFPAHLSSEPPRLPGPSLHRSIHACHAATTALSPHRTRPRRAPGTATRPTLRLACTRPYRSQSVGARSTSSI